MIAEIPDFPPVSGSIKEIHFDEYTNDVLWVSFAHETDSALSWVGTFQKWGDLSNTIQLEPLSQDRFAILIKGQLYFIDAIKQTLFGKSEFDDYRQFRVLPDENILATDGVTLEIISSTETIWESRRFAFDGVELGELNARIVSGTFDDGSPAGSKFQFNLETRELSCSNEIDFTMYP